MKTTYTVTVNETKETETFDTLEECVDWSSNVQKTFKVWNSEVTFKFEKNTTEEVTI